MADLRKWRYSIAHVPERTNMISTDDGQCSIDPVSATGISNELILTPRLEGLVEDGDDGDDGDGACPIYESSHTRITVVPDYRLPYGGRRSICAAVAKSLRSPLPSQEDILRLNNEFNILSRFLPRCKSVRAALGRSSFEAAAGEDGEKQPPTLFLEWIDGSTLREWVMGRRANGAADVERARDGTEQQGKNLLCEVKLLREVAAALAEVNDAGVVHNDLSADNIMVHDEGDGDLTVKLIDFGFASPCDALESDDVGETVNDDLFSLGLVFCEVLIDNPIPDAVRVGMDSLFGSFFDGSDLPRSLLTLLSDILELDSSDVLNPYRSAREVVEHLDQMLEDPDRFLYDLGPAEIAEELDFIPNKMYGKFEELSATLMGAYKRTIIPAESDDIRRIGPASEVVLISGSAGAGKSHLTRQIRAPLTERGGLFTSGKYEELRWNEPYSALVDAFSELSDQMLLWDKTYLERMRADILESVGAEGRVLTSFIPNLRRIIGEPEGDLADVNGIESRNRLNFVLRMFARAISRHDHPVVLVLEDLQWADAASLDIIEALVSDSKNESFLFVGCYRPEEGAVPCGRTGKRVSIRSSLGGGSVSSANSNYSAYLASQFAAFAAHLEELEEDDKLRITRIEVGNLERDSMNHLLSDALRLPRRLTKPLAEVIYPKTQGNIFFTKECLKSLKDDGLLIFDFDMMRWRWNADGIQHKGIADSAVDLIVGKIRKLSSEAQGALKLAACIGFRFDKTTLEYITGETDDETKHYTSTDNLDQNLDLLVSEGFIEVTSWSRYAFVHNRIHHVAFSLIPKRERNKIHLRIGEIMWQNASGEGEDLLFAAVDHMNRGMEFVEDSEQRINLAMLNVRAGEKSIAKSAFMPAVMYLKAGRKLLPEDHWEDHYDLSLRLFNIFIEAEHCNSYFEETHLHLGQVFSHAKSFGDKLPAYKILISSLGAQNKLHEALDTGLDVLSQLGQSFPKSIPSMAKIGTDYMKTRMVLRGKTDAVLTTLPMMEDKTLLDTMQIISSLVWYAYLSREELVPLLTFRMVRLTIRHGLSKITAFAFAMYGMILCGGMGDMKGGYRFGKLAMLLLGQFPAKEWVARVYGRTYFCIRHWREPMHLSLEPLLQSHQVGLEAGDTEYAFVIAHYYCCHAFQCGQSLVDLEIKAGELCLSMKEHQQETVLHMNLPIWQTVLNLMGRSSDLMRLTGEAMDEQTMLDAAIARGNQSAVYIIYFHLMVLAYLFGKYEVAADMAEKTRKIDQVIMGSFFACDHVYYSGLVASALSHTSKERKWHKLACKAKTKMKKMARNSPGNCLQKHLLLKAESAALRGDKERVKKYYDAAIDAAAKNGFIQDEAIANERASLFLKTSGDAVLESRYRTCSRTCYMKWGAFAKADQLLVH